LNSLKNRKFALNSKTTPPFSIKCPKPKLILEIKLKTKKRLIWTEIESTTLSNPLLISKRIWPPVFEKKKN